jgi:hypothetical protein
MEPPVNRPADPPIRVPSKNRGSIRNKGTHPREVFGPSGSGIFRLLVRSANEEYPVRTLRPNRAPPSVSHPARD